MSTIWLSEKSCRGWHKIDMTLTIFIFIDWNILKHKKLPFNFWNHQLNIWEIILFVVFSVKINTK